MWPRLPPPFESLRARLVKIPVGDQVFALKEQALVYQAGDVRQ